MGLIHKAQLPYIDSLKKNLQLKANLWWIHFLLNQTSNTFYQTKELFKWSPAPNSIFLMVKGTHTQYLFYSKWTRSCTVLPKQGNHREAMLISLDVWYLLLHSQLELLCSLMLHTGWDIPVHPSEQAQRTESYGQTEQ